MTSTKYYKNIVHFGVLCLSFVSFSVFAEWHLQFSEEKLDNSRNNRQVLSSLQDVFTGYAESYNPVLQFTFHQKQYSQARWQHLLKQLPMLKEYHYQIYHSPDKDRLSIGFRIVTNDTCPTQIIIKDRALPVPDDGLRLSGSASLAVSSQVKLFIEQQQNLVVIAHNVAQQTFKPIVPEKSFQPTVPNLGTNLLIMQNSNPKNLEQAKKNAINLLNQKKFSHKGMSLSPVPIADYTIEDKKQSSYTNCIIKLTPLLREQN